MTDITPDRDPLQPPPTAAPGDGRSVKDPEGEDPRDTDRLHDPDVAAGLTSGRHLTHAQPAEGAMGTSSDAAGHDPADRDHRDG